MNKNKDRLFIDPKSQTPFCFDQKVSKVFDDMIERSIPHYYELQNKIIHFCKMFSKKNQVIYDLGCSTGTTLQRLSNTLVKHSIFYGIDSSQEMLTLAKNKVKQYKSHTFIFQKENIQNITLEPANIILSNLTIQFIPLKSRLNTLKNIYNTLNKDGIFIFVEKINIPNKSLSKIYKNDYYDFKQQQGYSSEEIHHKEKSLDNILVPLSIKENEKMLKDAGFEQSKTSIFFFQHLFCGWICIK